jgi:4-hydroxy-tetrahydrodipicolinate reductase
VIDVAILGAGGKMGQAVANAVRNHGQMRIAEKLVDDGTFGIELLLDVGSDINQITPKQSGGDTDVVVEFTVAGQSMRNVQALLRNGNCNILVGTSGWNDADLNRLRNFLHQYPQAKVLVVPNFSISAVLQMLWAKQAAKLFEDVDIIEYHHKAKIDKPSGTALKLQDDFETLISRRPEIHSIRSSGYIATQTVNFANSGERLVITQDVIGRDAFMRGVLLSIKKIMTDEVGYGLTIGLENLLF